jgi:phosphatidylglycerophosphate synthase
MRASVVTVTLTGLVASAALASIARGRLQLDAWYPVFAAGCFALIMVPVIGVLRGHPLFDRFGLANQITTGRAMLVALVAGFIGEPRRPAVAASAAIIGLIVVALDGVDGWVARRSRTVSDFGARFDMEIDALLILVLAILVWQYGKAGPWVVLSGLLRYVFLGAGWLWPTLQQPLPPSRRRQTICVVQIVGLVLAIAPIITPPLSTALAAATLLTLCYSFLVDTLWLWHHAP